MYPPQDKPIPALETIRTFHFHGMSCSLIWSSSTLVEFHLVAKYTMSKHCGINKSLSQEWLQYTQERLLHQGQGWKGKWGNFCSGEAWVHQNNLTPPPFLIEVPVQSHESDRSCICVLAVSTISSRGHHLLSFRCFRSDMVYCIYLQLKIQILVM